MEALVEGVASPANPSQLQLTAKDDILGLCNFPTWIFRVGMYTAGAGTGCPGDQVYREAGWLVQLNRSESGLVPSPFRLTTTITLTLNVDCAPGGRPTCSDTITVTVTSSGRRIVLEFRTIPGRGPNQDAGSDQERERLNEHAAWPAYRNTDPNATRHMFLHRFGFAYWAIGGTLDGLEMAFATGVTAGWQYGCPGAIPESEWHQVPHRPHGCCEIITVTTGLEGPALQPARMGDFHLAGRFGQLYPYYLLAETEQVLYYQVFLRRVLLIPPPNTHTHSCPTLVTGSLTLWGAAL